MNVFCGPFFDCAGYKKRDLRALLVMLFCMLLGPVSLVNAQELTVNEQYDAAFLEMYEDVGNLDKTFRFAELAIAVGDLEGAVAALERMLIIEPDLPQVRMQLGTLYFQLASYAMALTYLNAVVAHDEVPDDVKQGAQDLITQIDALTSPHRFNGTVVAGVRYQSNANGGPMTQNIRLFGGSAVLDEEYTRQSDWMCLSRASSTMSMTLKRSPA
jgi:tetratricopeptide (TPR) repeat protein